MGRVKKITMMLLGAAAAFAMAGGVGLGANYEWAGGASTDSYDWASPGADAGSSLDG